MATLAIFKSQNGPFWAQINPNDEISPNDSFSGISDDFGLKDWAVKPKANYSGQKARK